MLDTLNFFIRDRDPLRRQQKKHLLSKAKSGSVKALDQLAHLCKESGDISSAIKYHKQIALRGGRNAAAASNNIGKIYFEDGNLQEAFNYFEYAAKNGLTLAKKNIGVLFEKEEQIEAAISWYQLAANEGNTFSKDRLQRLLARPRPAYIDSWQDAEYMAQKWMFYFGYFDAQVTKAGSDGGVDVIANNAIAQVKFEQSKTGRPKLQEITGEAVTSGKKAFFFSLSGYTKSAIEWAESSPVGLALFQYDSEGMVTAVNQKARTVLLLAKKNR